MSSSTLFQDVTFCIEECIVLAEACLRQSAKDAPKQKPESVTSLPPARDKHTDTRLHHKVVAPATIIQLHLSVRSRVDSKIAQCSAEQASKPHLEWRNDFSLTAEAEQELLDCIRRLFPFEQYGFALHDKYAAICTLIDSEKHKFKSKTKESSQLMSHIRSAVNGKSMLEFNTHFIAKLVHKMYDLRSREWCLLLNQTLSKFFQRPQEQKWWKRMLSDLSTLKAEEWMQKCWKWKIMPSRLLKDFLAATKLFINDPSLSANLDSYQRAFLAYYQERPALTEEDYWKPLGTAHENNPPPTNMETEEEMHDEERQRRQRRKQQLKSDKNKGYKNINAFLSEIGRMPLKYGGYDKFVRNADGETLSAQHRVYHKWVRYSHDVHRTKWMRYLKRRIERNTQKMRNGVWCDDSEVLSEYQETKTQRMHRYAIPNSDNLLTVSVCQEMCKILLMDGVLGINTQLQSRANAASFEEFVFGAVATVLGEQQAKSIMMSEQEVRESQHAVFTPDILFTSPVNINGVDVYWIDAKNYYVTQKDAIAFQSIGKQIANYAELFGNGAIVCCGFQSDFVQLLKRAFPQITANVLMLDASAWFPFTK